MNKTSEAAKTLEAARNLMVELFPVKPATATLATGVNLLIARF